ncbi:MAG: hypothetical protein A3H32_03120 [Betaproteobacteria bacterium RIFCSPLOWO2_02_FULL_63_19]|nr:MAG: hypothetical protein A3H32_03120 [Betaproteobacteria bacterium RIFCSPLOWO2_02_FULL_63_19]
MDGMNGLQVPRRVNEDQPWLAWAVVIGPATYVHGRRNPAAGVSGFFYKKPCASSVKSHSAKLDLPEHAATSELRLSPRRRRTHAAASGAAGQISSREVANTTS